MCIAGFSRYLQQAVRQGAKGDPDPHVWNCPIAVFQNHLILAKLIAHLVSQVCRFLECEAAPFFLLSAGKSRPARAVGSDFFDLLNVLLRKRKIIQASTALKHFTCFGQSTRLIQAFFQALQSLGDLL